jgi:tetraprenyl-beta-curcumene synthase
MPATGGYARKTTIDSTPMSAIRDRPLMVRVGKALVLANTRYWRTVAPLARTQLGRWTRHAESIPDATLQGIALTNLREEGFNAQATATLAALAPRTHRGSVVEAIVALQIIYDYLDSLVELPLANPIGDGRRLYQALIDAVVLDRKPQGEYYANALEAEDGGYLADLVQAVRQALTRLPKRAVIAQASMRAATRCAEAQVHAHADSVLDDAQLIRWAANYAADPGLQSREFLAGAVSSTLALHALIAAAADPATSREQVRAIDDVYLAIAALTTLLDGLIDYKQDILSTGRPGYIRYYEDHSALIAGLRHTISHATARARDTPNEAYHLMTLVGVVAYYGSAPTASSVFARPVIRQIRRDLRPLITPTLAVMHTWRIAKRLRRIAVTMACRSPEERAPPNRHAALNGYNPGEIYWPIE